MISKLETRESRVKEKEKKAEENKKLYDRLIPEIIRRERDVAERENNISSEIRFAARRMTEEDKKNAELNYLQKAKELEQDYDSKYESWHKFHDFKYYGMLMFLMVFGVVHAFIYNDRYLEYFEAVLNIIKNIFILPAKGIWLTAVTVGKLGELIPNEIAAKIVSVIIIGVVLLGIIALIIWLLFYKIIGSLIEYWARIELWDSITLQVAVILIGVSTIISAPFNIVGVALLVFIGYIVLRSIIMWDDVETRRNVLQTIVTALVMAVTIVGGMIYIVWMFAQLYK
ncbi:MAG: DUF6040 family protein [Eubacterium sp.]|nr:DUF6040 family protein [Eubacterium sp.]